MYGLMASPSKWHIKILSALAIDLLFGSTTYSVISATTVQHRHNAVIDRKIKTQRKAKSIIRGMRMAKNSNGTASAEPMAHSNGSASFETLRNRGVITAAIITPHKPPMHVVTPKIRETLQKR